MQTILISDIKVGPRQRCLYEDIDKLASSIKRYGLIQPIVLAQDNSLIAGGRRLKAMQTLGYDMVPFVYKESLNAVQQAEMELEENVRRNALTWQETCIAIAQIHTMKTQDAAASGEEWGYYETGELLGKVKSNIWYACRIGELLSTDEELRKQPTMSDAIKLLLARKEKEVAALIVSQMKSKPTTVKMPVYNLDEGNLDTDKAQVPQTQSASQCNEEFAKKHCFSDDALNVMAGLEDASVDHIYTDPPYGIDMENLIQSGTGQDVSRVAAEHKVDENLELLNKFMEESHRVLKPTGFCVLWCDMDNWDYLRKKSEAVGFAVCRWPLVWCKTDACINQMAYFNFTKATEFAMVLRMPQARLLETRGVNHWTGGNDRQDHDTHHPFWKPLALHKWILGAISMPGQTVLDPFAGEGSIPLACLESQRDFIAVEKVDIHYVQMVKNVTTFFENPHERNDVYPI